MEPADLRTARLLIIDDEPQNLELLEGLLAVNGFGSPILCERPGDAVGLFVQCEPDLVLVDSHLPEVTCVEVVRTLRSVVTDGDHVPIIVMTADPDRELRRDALRGGASDFLLKPFDVAEVLLRIQNHLQIRRLQMTLREQNRALEERVLTRTRDLESAHREIVERLARAAEFRDDDTGDHIRRVGQLAGRLASEVGLSQQECQLLELAAMLHDIGKIGIPDRILLKPGALEPDEFEVMRTHTQIGARILSNAQSELLRMAHDVAVSHHDRWDGVDNLSGLRGDQIPLAGRIVAVADVYDALTHERHYKRAWTQDEALDYIRAESGRKFDPTVVYALLTIFHADPTGVAESAMEGQPQLDFSPGQATPARSA
jgi:putative two-component system response regulator